MLEARAATLGARQTRDADALGQAERRLRAELAALLAAAASRPALAASPAFAMLRQSSATLDREIAERQELYDEADWSTTRRSARSPGTSSQP